MSETDYEPQPDIPDLGEFVQEDPAETLVGPPGSDPLDAGYIPPDRPYGLDDDQTTTRIDAEPEPLDTALGRERLDVDPDAPDPTVDTDPDRSGRLVAADPELDGSLEGTDAGIDGGAASAEEAAVHERAEEAALDERAAPGS